MTNEEALYWLKHIRDTIVGIHSPMERTGKTYNFKRVMALDIAIQALEKETPKPTKPIRVGTVNYPTCPICGRVIWKEEQYCASCGQLLDREGE